MSNAADWTGFEQHVNGKGERRGPLRDRRFVRCNRRFGDTEGAVWAALAVDCGNGFPGVNAWPAQFEAEMDARHNPGFACKGPTMVKVMQQRVRAQPSLQLRFLSGQGFHSSGISWIKKYVQRAVSAGQAHTMSGDGFMQFLQSPYGCPSSAKSQFRCFEWLARGGADANVSIIRLLGHAAAAAAPAPPAAPPSPAAPSGLGDVQEEVQVAAAVAATSPPPSPEGAAEEGDVDEAADAAVAEAEAVAEAVAADEEALAPRSASEGGCDATELPPSPGGGKERNTREMSTARRKRMKAMDAEHAANRERQDAEYAANRKRLKYSLFGEQDTEEEQKRARLGAKALRRRSVQESVDALRAATATTQRGGCEEVDVNLEKRKTSSNVLAEIGTRGDVLVFWAADGNKKELRLAAGDAEHNVDVCAVVDQGDNIHVYFCESKANGLSNNAKTALGQTCVARDMMESDDLHLESSDVKELMDTIGKGVAEAADRGDDFHKPEAIYHFVAAFCGTPGTFLTQSFRKRGDEVWCYFESTGAFEF
jgi:hypothetical protein